MTKTLVIGAGIAGLATAALLAHEGHEVHVLEMNDQVGGRAGLHERDGFRFDTGPSWYLMPRVFDHFFELLGTTTAEQLDLTFLSPSYRVFREPDTAGTSSEPLTIPLGKDQVLETFNRVEPGSAETLTTYLRSARRATDMAEKYFLYNPFTKLSSLTTREVLGAAPELTRLLGTSLESYVAKRFTDPMLRQVLGYPAVFLGTNPADAPAIYHLMSALDLDTGVQYPMGGFWQVAERLAALATDAGTQITTGAEVVRIVTDGNGRKSKATGVIWTDHDGVQHREDADIVVSCADLHHTETQLLPPRHQSYPERWWRKRTSGPGAVIGMLGVRGEVPELPHHSLFFTNDWHKNFDSIFGNEPQIPEPASIYVCKPSATDAGVAPEGHENLFILIPVPAETDIGHGGADGSGDVAVEQAVDMAIAQLESWAGIPDLGDRIVVRETRGPADFATTYHSWQGGMLGPSHILSQSALFRAQNASKKISNLFYAGATTAPGVGVPMCLISAELVLKRIRGDHTAGPVAAPRQVDGAND